MGKVAKGVLATSSFGLLGKPKKPKVKAADAKDIKQRKDGVGDDNRGEAVANARRRAQRLASRKSRKSLRIDRDEDSGSGPKKTRSAIAIN